MAKYGEPVISRETRLLLTTIVVSVLSLWLLARIRFQDRPVTPDPVPPVLAQLRPQSSFDDLARAVADMRPTIAATVFARADGRPALRIRPDAAVTLAPAASATHLAFDRATRLAIVRSPQAELPGLMPWVPRVLDYPRYLIVTEITQRNVALRLVFVGGLFAISSPLWGGEIWLLPRSVDAQPGAFVFTTDGALAGLAIADNGRSAIVPATHLLNLAEQMLREGPHQPGTLGISVQPLTASVAAATGSAAGVVVTAVDPAGPAARTLAATDVIEAVNGDDIITPEHWHARVERVRAGETLSLRVRRNGAVHEVQVTATALESASSQTLPPESEAAQDNRLLGLSMRGIPRTGVEVVSVAPDSSAARANIQPGDVITVAGEHQQPTSAQITRAFASLPDGGLLLVALTRGGEHHVVVLEK